MTQGLESISQMLRKIGANLGVKFALDDRGALALSYAGEHACVLVAAPGHPLRIGMIAPLFPCPTNEQCERALRTNANLERESGVLALDASGRLIFTAARDADDLTEEGLAAFMGDFMRVSVELFDALRMTESAPSTFAGHPVETTHGALFA